ncbi:MAG TPA: rod shape-determining protein MreC [Candidatus Paceibacterota bacterium]
MITNFRHDRQKRAERRKLLGYIFIFAVILLVFRTLFFDVFSSIFFRIAQPLWAVERFAGDRWREGKNALLSKESLIAENRRLSEALDFASLEAYARGELRNENEQLKKMLGRVSERSLLLARVLATPGRSPYDTLLIDAGLEEGLTPGMKIFTDGDFVIGEVSRVMKGGATVTLYSSYGNELPVTVGTNSIPATAKGEGGGNFRIALPKGVQVSPGDLVHIPALAPEYVGIVQAVDHPSGGSLQDIYLKWPLNINELAWVYIAIDPHTEVEQPQ